MSRLDQIIRLPNFRLGQPQVCPTGIELAAESLLQQATCPSCQTPTTRIHSRYVRRLRGLPWNGKPLSLLLTLHRFRCLAPTCPRTTFVEPIPTLAPPFARRTNDLGDLQRVVGLVVGGEAGARLTARLQMATSGDTLLRLMRQTVLPSPPPPTVTGVDDWAKRKGHCYGTIICDLETHRPIALLDDRTVETVAAWFEQQPQVTVISRDRATAYADAAHRGAPQAQQIADRFHLLMNLRKVVLTILQQQRKALRALRSPAAPDSAEEGGEGAALDSPAEAAALSMDVVAAQRRLDRHEQYDTMRAAWAEGWSQPQIAAMIGVSHRTVQRWLANPTLRDRQRRPRTGSQLDRYQSVILEQWEAGVRTGASLYRALQKAGYRGSYRLVNHYLAQHRPPDEAEQRRRSLRQQALTPPICTPNEASWLFMRAPEKLNETEQQTLALVQQTIPTVVPIYEMVQAFRRILLEQKADEIDAWVKQVKQSDSETLKQFVTGLERDWDAVVAAMREPWSNGVVEGQIQRLKLVKRMMYGRAKLDLLRIRFLAAA